MAVSSEHSYRILICHPDSTVLQDVGAALREAGFFVVTTHHARQAVDRMASVLFDLVILAEEAEPIGQHSLVHHMRMFNGRVPIAVLGSRAQRTDRSEAGIPVDAELGDDDQVDYFLPFPFTPEAVVNLAKAALVQLNRETEKKQRAVRAVGGLVVDPKRKQVAVDGKTVPLTPSEYNILSFLMSDPGTVYSAEDIYRAVWQQEPLNSNNVVTVHICHIREKIEVNPKCPTYLKVLWGKGYYIDPQAN